MKDWNTTTGMLSDNDYPRGKTIADGQTKINQNINRDIISLFQKISLGGNGDTPFTPNGNYDNEINGYQLLANLVRYISGLGATNTNKVWYKKRLTIGTWNMKTTGGVTIAHGLDANLIKRIVNVSVIIFDDFLYPNNTSYILGGYDGLTNSSNGGVLEITSTNISLYRKPGSFFEVSSDFVGTNSRGLIFIEIYDSTGEIESE